MKATQAQQLQETVTDAGVVLFHDAQHRGYASFPLNGHVETWPLRSGDFRRFLALVYYRRFGRPVRREVIAEQLEILQAKAQFDGPMQSVYVRLAPSADGGLVLDLGADDWSVVEIDADGWRWRPSSSVRFIRPPGLKPLVTPEHGGAIEQLRPFLNVADDDQWRLLVGFLVGAFHPSGPYPVLALNGEQGSAKSTAMRIMRSLIDPRDALDRAAPRDERDLAVHAARNVIVALDNLSYLPDWLSDALARLATGAGFSTRQLYTDDEEVTLNSRRPIIVNGIGSIVTRSDLLDRSLIVTLGAVSADHRREEGELWAAFHAAQPSILGALLQAVSCAIARRREVKLDSLPRMADFARWVTAAEPALGFSDGSFLHAYYANRGAAHELAIEADAVAGAVVAFMTDRAEWEGTPSTLLQHLSDLAGETQARQKTWPKAPHALSNRMQRATPNLRAVGIDIEFSRDSKRRVVRLRRQASSASAASPRTDGEDWARVAEGDANDGRDAPLHPLAAKSLTVVPTVGLR